MEHVVKKFLAVIAAVSTLALTGCGTLNTAANVGSITITQTELQNSINEILTERAAVDTTQMQLQSGADLNQAELRFKIIVTIFDQIAKELKIRITNGELASAKSSLIQQSGGAAALGQNLVAAQIPSSEFDTYVRAIVTTNKLTEALKASGVAEADVSAKLAQLVTAKAKEMKVSVNPRYGVWNPEETSLTMIDSAGSAITAPTQG